MVILLRLYGRALSLRKKHLITRALWLIDGIVHPSELLEGHDDIHSDTQVDRETPSPRPAAPSRGVQWLKPYPTQHAEFLGVPLMPRNPFRDTMGLRSRAKGARYCKAAFRSGVLANCEGNSSGRNSLDLVEARAATSKKGRFRYAARWREIAMLHRLLETGPNRRSRKTRQEDEERSLLQHKKESGRTR